MGREIWLDDSQMEHNLDQKLQNYDHTALVSERVLIELL